MKKSRKKQTAIKQQPKHRKSDKTKLRAMIRKNNSLQDLINAFDLEIINK